LPAVTTIATPTTTATTTATAAATATATTVSSPPHHNSAENLLVSAALNRSKAEAAGDRRGAKVLCILCVLVRTFKQSRKMPCLAYV
jgi:hypothetical protein